MLMCVLHCLWGREDPWGIVGQFRDAVVPGSYLALSHMTGEAHPQAADGLFRMTQELPWNTPLISRDRAEITRFFDGFTLVQPGLVPPARWRPDLDNPLRDLRVPMATARPAQAGIPQAARRRSRDGVALLRGRHQGPALNSPRPHPAAGVSGRRATAACQAGAPRRRVRAACQVSPRGAVPPPVSW